MFKFEKANTPVATPFAKIFGNYVNFGVEIDGKEFIIGTLNDDGTFTFAEYDTGSEFSKYFKCNKYVNNTVVRIFTHNATISIS